MHLKEAAIIVAGGKGLRLPGDMPKQFMEICGQPVLMHTLHAFRTYSPSLEIILVLPDHDFEQWKSLCKQYQFNTPVNMVAGGATRFLSVKRGLDHLAGPGFVAVHDGVRPLVTSEIIQTSFVTARKYRSAVASVSLKESIRELRDEPSVHGDGGQDLSNKESFAADRTKFRVMQTPQTFDIDLLKSAYAAAKGDSFTDDASVVEAAGHAIALFEGSYENIKITTPDDLAAVKAIMGSRTR